MRVSDRAPIEWLMNDASLHLRECQKRIIGRGRADRVDTILTGTLVGLHRLRFFQFREPNSTGAAFVAFVVHCVSRFQLFSLSYIVLRMEWRAT